MAIDPRISLAVQAPDIMTALTGGLRAGEQIRNAGVRDQLLNQQAQVNQMNIANAQGAHMNKLAQALGSVPAQDRAAVLAQQMPYLEQLGIDPAQMLSGDLTDQGVQELFQATLPFAQQKQAGGSKGYQFGASNLIKDDEGTVWSVTQVRDPVTGSIKVEKAPIDGELVSTTGETTAERAEREVSTSTGKIEGRLSTELDYIPLTGGAETDVLAARQQRIGGIESEQAIAKQEQLNALENKQNFLIQYSENARAAASSLPSLEEAYRLAQTADQGLDAGAMLFLSKLPGMQNIDISDTAALDSALKSLALDQLQKFKGPTTDFEFGVVQDISGSILGSKQANIARVAALKRANWFAQREAEQAKQWVANNGDPLDFRFNFQEPIQIGGVTYTLQDLQDTARRYSMGIDETISELGRLGGRK